jgi:tripartite-type tricarboxylate transporter receptor subunit TctC
MRDEAIPWRTVAVAALLAALAPPAFAQPAYPAKPIRIIVPTSPPGGADVVARAIAQPMSERFGQQVYIDNRAGASTMLGGELAARAAPDGYTLVMGISTLAINPAAFRKVPYDALRDFTPITHAAIQALLLAVHPSFPAKSVKELVAIAKSRPGDVVYSSPGFGTNPQMGMVLFLHMTGTKMLHVPYRGGGESILALASGQVMTTVSSMLGLMPQVRAGRIRALGVTAAQRVASAPDIPTIAEAGVPGYATTTWYGLLAPAATRPAVIERLAGAANKAVMSPDLRERMLSDGAEPIGSSPAAFQKHIATEVAKWRKVVQAAGVKAE